MEDKEFWDEWFGSDKELLIELIDKVSHCRVKSKTCFFKIKMDALFLELTMLERQAKLYYQGGVRADEE